MDTPNTDRECGRCGAKFAPPACQFRRNRFICRPCRNKREQAYRRNARARGLKMPNATKRYDDRRKASPDYQVKEAARLAARRAVRHGKLIRQPCEACGDLNTQAHHDDYSRPLDVRWLCAIHHAEFHRMNRSAVSLEGSPT